MPEGKLARKFDAEAEKEMTDEAIEDLTHLVVEIPPESEGLKAKKAVSEAAAKANIAKLRAELKGISETKKQKNADNLRARLNLPKREPVLKPGESIPGQTAMEGVKRRQKMKEGIEARGKETEDVVFAENIVDAAEQAADKWHDPYLNKVAEATKGTPGFSMEKFAELFKKHQSLDKQIEAAGFFKKFGLKREMKKVMAELTPMQELAESMGSHSRAQKDFEALTPAQQDEQRKMQRDVRRMSRGTGTSGGRGGIGKISG